MNLRMIFYFLGWVLNLEAACLLLPCLVALLYRENQAGYFLLSAGICLAAGLLLTFKRPHNRGFYAREGFVSVALGWIVLSMTGALPFFISGLIPNYIDALFEIVSGFTTTGSSVLSDVEALGRAMLFWRSFSHWIGGMGVLVLILAVLPMADGYHMLLMKAESPGPSVSKLVPRVSDTAKALYRIYLFMTLVMITVYLLSGMPLFDAICIGFGTAGTGGFAVRNSGMNDYSVLSQFLISVFMILFGINFNVYYLLARKKIKAAFSCQEAKTYLMIILVAVLLIAWNITAQTGSLFLSLHHALFTVGSVITTTGFATLDFTLWPQFSQMLLLILMFCGACAGSTGGGIKVSRVIMMLRQASKELHLIIHPQSVRVVKMEGKKVEHAVIRSVHAFLISYIAVFFCSLLLLSLDQFDFTTNFSAVAATLNNIGPGLGAVGPYGNFSAYSDLSKIVLIFDMLAGRLELMPMLILFSPKTWQKYSF